MTRWVNCSKGVRYREHETRRHNKRADRYYMLTYKRNGKTTSEGIGWASDGHTQAEAEDLIEAMRKNWRSGAGPQSLREMRGEERDKAKAAKEQEEAKAKQEITLAEYWASHYLPTGKGKKVDSTWTKELEHYKNWIAPLLGDIPIIKIETTHWDALVKAVRDKGRSQRSVEYIAGTLRHILRHAQARKFPCEIPKAKVIDATAPQDNKRERILTPKEESDLLEALQSRDIRVFRVVRFAMLTGCRLGEALGLKWGAVNLDRACVTFKKTKNKDSRTVYLGKVLMSMFADMREEMGFTKRATPTANEFVFLNERGKPWTSVPGAFLDTVKRLEFNKDRDPLDRVSFHTTRHTAATELADEIDIRSMMELFGWKTVAMAVRYIHSNDGALRRAASRLEGRSVVEKDDVEA